MLAVHGQTFVDPQVARSTAGPGRLVAVAEETRWDHGCERCPGEAPFGGLPRIGARVPEDVAVIGVDNDELMCGAD